MFAVQSGYVFHKDCVEIQNLTEKTLKDIHSIERLVLLVCNLFGQVQILKTPYLGRKMFTPGSTVIFDFKKISDIFTALATKTSKHRIRELRELTYLTTVPYGSICIKLSEADSVMFTISVNDVYQKFESRNACAECSVMLKSVKTCSGCGIAKYCCAEHQKAHWKVHKHHCKRLIKEVD